MKMRITAAKIASVGRKPTLPDPSFLNWTNMVFWAMPPDTISAMPRQMVEVP